MFHLASFCAQLHNNANCGSRVQMHETEGFRLAIRSMKTQWMSVEAPFGAGEASTQMSSTATRFLAQIRCNLESWRAREIDYVTFSESQRNTWAGIRAAGRQVEAEVLRALTGLTCVAELLLGEDTQQRTLQLWVQPTAALPPARRYHVVAARTPAGCPALQVLATEAWSRPVESRQIAALTYEFAADIERRSQELEAHWTIAADPESGQIVIELTGHHEAELAEELLANVMAAHQLT
jgi:hypothetical protein